MENLAWKATWLSLACALECLWDYIEGVTQLVKQTIYWSFTPNLTSRIVFTSYEEKVI